jgi:hypothetical protein
MDHSAIIQEYKKFSVGCVRNDKVIKFCKEAPNLEMAITRASMAKNEYGHKHVHQKRFVGDEKLKLLREKLLRQRTEIQKINSFDELFEIVVKTNVFDNARDSLTVYDTALRLGFFLDKLPDRIYLHEGSRVGVEKIRGQKIKSHFIMKNYLNEPFKS